MNEFGDKCALVWDNYLFVHIAQKLAESFGKVYYGGNWVNAFPKSNLTLPGDGLDGITRIKDFWTHKDEADLIVFPDVMYADVQEECIRQGKRVYGARSGEWLELNRWKAKQLFARLGMPVGESHYIEGMDSLREFLQERKGHWWIKTSRYRGDFETFDSEDYDEVKPVLDEKEHDLGRKAIAYPFIVERHIDAILEVGYDGDTIDGQFPSLEDMAIFGIERKDTGYLGIAKPYGEFPEVVRWVNEKLRVTLAQAQYRGFFSTEIRAQKADEVSTDEPKQWRDCPMIWNLGDEVDGMRAFLTDPCCRCASPPSELYIEWVKNWPKKMWDGAEGKMVPMEIDDKYGVEIMLHSSWADKNWQPVRFPDDIARYVKLRNVCRIDGIYSAVPQSVGLPEIGAVVGHDDDFLTAISTTIDRAKQVKGYFIEPKITAIQEVVSEIEQAQENGLEFTDDPLPTPDDISEALELA